MFIIQCSIQWEGCACFTLQSLSKRGGMRDKHTHMSYSMSSLDLYLVFIAVRAENAVSHKYVIENGSRTSMALSDSSEYSWKHASQNDNSGSLLNCKRSVLTDDNSANCSCSRPVKLVSSHSKVFRIQSYVLTSSSPKY